MDKPKIAFFSLTSCEGCQLVVLSMADRLLEIAGAVDIVNFREASSYKGQDYAVAIIEGAITTVQQIEEAKEIRQKAEVVIALGACAHIGGINAIKNSRNQNLIRQQVYGDKAYVFDTILAQPLDAVIKVDYYARGCPPNRAGDELYEIITALLQGKKPYLPNFPVCTQCKMQGNVCVFHKEKPLVCLGPVTRAGCNAACPSAGNSCLGCRGLVDNPNLETHTAVLHAAGLTVPEILKFYRMLNGLMEVGK